MKINIILLMIVCLLTSCLKNSNVLDYRGIEALIINPKSNFPSKTAFPLPVDDSVGVTKLNLIARYSFQTPAPKDIKVTFTRDDALADKYNLAFGTNYVQLPADSYEMASNQVIISKGSQDGIIPIRLIPSRITGTTNYIIAFSITNTEGIKMAENLKSIVFTLRGQ